MQIHKKKREKNYVCILLTDFNEKLKDYYILFSEMLLNTNIISSIILLNSLLTPLYTTGLVSGIIINLGSISSSIIPIYNNYIIYKQIKKIDISAIEIQQLFLIKIVIENFISKNIDINIEQFIEEIVPNINDLFIRSILCVNKTINLQLFKTKDIQYNQNDLLIDNSDLYEYFKTLKNDINKIEFNYRKSVNNTFENLRPNTCLNISLLNRIFLGEVLFVQSNTSEIEEIFYNLNILNFGVNIIDEVINLLLELSIDERLKLSQNIILSGGLSQTLGIYKRFVDELKYEIEFNKQYESLKNLKKMNVHKILFTKNCLSWIGGNFIIFNFSQHPY